MAFKINISTKDGKSWKLDSDSEILIGRKLGETIKGQEITPDLAGYELKITGASDIAGFPHKQDVEGPQLRGLLFTKGWGMHKKPKKEGKKPVSTPRGLRLRKSVRGKEISDKTKQINLIVVTEGSKKFSEIFPEQNKAPEAPTSTEEKPVELAQNA